MRGVVESASVLSIKMLLLLVFTATDLVSATGWLAHVCLLIWQLGFPVGLDGPTMCAEMALDWNTEVGIRTRFKNGMMQA